MRLEDGHRESPGAALDERTVAADPFTQCAEWVSAAQRAMPEAFNVMTLATVGAEGVPDARTVLLKSLDQNGLVFFTDFRSAKAQQLAANPMACLLFFWGALERQIRVTGPVERIPAEDSASYFASRPRGSQLGAWASHQSAVLPGGRPELEAALHAVEERIGNDPVPLPPHWGGYLLRPEGYEFWQGRENRLHDRIRYRRHEGRWIIERLSP